MKKNNDELIVSLDFGTSNLKGAVYDMDGKEIAYESIESSLYTPSNSIVENDLNLYWDNIVIILKNLAKKLGDKSKNVVAIGTSSQGETIVPIDKSGNPLRNAIVWIDTRTTAQVLEFKRNFSTEEMYKKSGCPDVDTSWPATRILWMKQNEPDIFKNTYKFLLLEDYIIFKLTNRFAGEATVYSSSYYYDIVKFEYITPVLDFLEIGKDRLPDILMPGTIVGNITQKTAEITGFSKFTKVVIGAMDQICGAVGAGNISNGIATETTGSCFAMVVTTAEPMFNYEQKIPCIPHAVPGLYALMPYSPTGGIVIKWFRDRFCSEEQISAHKENKDIFKIMDDEAEKIPAGSEGLIMLPFLTGALFPEYNPDARGVYFNFSINHTKAHFIRAGLESIGFMMKNYLESLGKMGINIEKIISIGGGASSKLWSQIKADMSEKVIEIPSCTEMALLGSTILTASALGFFKNISDAGKNIVKMEHKFLPDKN
ncbi:MAG: FGGY family carbohydrate kinase, partial [Actinomycetota bacterium]